VPGPGGAAAGPADRRRAVNDPAAYRFADDPDGPTVPAATHAAAATRDHDDATLRSATSEEP
jgi:hypothetical protein